MRAISKDGKIRAEMIEVTPALATKWLEGNVHNRALRDAKVRSYAKDMKAGRWGLSHQGIAFDPSDTLIDGQHRLWAIVESGETIEMMVTRGLGLEAQEYIDQNIGRTMVDICKLADPETNVDKYRVAVARRALVGTRTQVTVSNQELRAFMDQHVQAIDFAIDKAMQGKRPMRVAPASVPAAIARAFYHEDRDKLISFGAILLGSEIPQSEADKGAHLLREWFLQGAPTYGARIARDLFQYLKVQRGLVAFLNGEALRSLYPMRDEAWALPDEQRREKRTSRARRHAA